VRILGESAVFLSLSYREALGLPPLEAMACACLVAGFDGGGGREYMTPDNGWWAEPGDWKAAIDGLAAALDLLNSGGPALVARMRAAEATVDRYHPAQLESALMAFWTAELRYAAHPHNLVRRFDRRQDVVSIEFGD
jgi:glycosyltransferase involved in cell wall biosynthesis